MAERNIDPGGGEEGGGSVEPHDNQSPRNGEKGSDQRGDVGARPPEVGFSVPEASVKLEKEGGMKKAPNETKSDSPLSHQKTSSTQDSVQPSPRRNRRSEKKKRYIQNKKKRKELEDDQSKSSVKGDTPPASDNEMEFDDAQQEQEETSHNTAFSSESQDQEEQTSKNDTLQCETAVMVRSDSSHVVQDSRPPLETKGENKIPSIATSGPEGIHCDIQGGSVPPLEPVGASETQGEPKSKPAEVSTSIPVFGNNDTLQSVTAVLVPSDNCHVVQDSRPPLETKGENKAPSIATSGPEGNHRDIQGSSMPPLEPIEASETQVDNQWQRCDERSSEIVNVEAYTMETSGHPGDGSIEMGGDELPRGSKVSEYEATRGSVVKEVEASSKKKGDKAVGALKVKGGEFAVGSKEKESEYDSLETHFKQTGWKGNDSGSEVADGLKEERVKATDGPKKKGNEDVGQNAGGLKVKEHEAAGGSMKQRDGSNEKGDDSGQADRGTKETGDVDGGQTGGGLKWKGDEDGGKAASGLTEKEDIAGLNESEDEADLKEKRDKFIDGSKTKGDEDVGQDAGGLEEGEHEAAGGSIKQRDSLKEKRGDSGQAGGGTKEKGDEDGGQTGGGLKGKAHKDGGGSARGLTKKDDVAAVGSKKTGDEAAGGLKKGNQSDCGSNEKGDGCGRGLKKVHESAGTSKEKDQSAHSLKEKGDQAAGGSKEKGNDAAVGSKKKKDQAEIGLKVKVDEVGDVSKEKGHQANSGLKDKEDEVSDGAKKKDEATGGSKEKRRQADSGLKEKGDKTAGGSKKKEDQAESGLKVKVDEVGDGSKEKGHQANSGLKDKEDEVSDGAKKKDEATGGSKEKRRQADSGLKEKGDKTAGGSGRRIDAGNAGCVKDGDAVRSLNSSENVGSGSDWWDSSSKEARAENTMVIVLHAFIQPDAWSIDSKDLQHAIHVYSEHLEWKQNCAKVNVRQCDKLTWSVEAHLQLPKAWERKCLQYKYYVCASKQPSDDNYEHLAHSGGGIHNRCLVPNRNYHYDARDHCYHHFDDFICPTRPPDSWTGKLKKFLGFKDVNDLKPQSLLEHLHCYSNNPTPTIRAVLCQDVSAAVEDITHKFSEVYGSYSCSRTGQPRLNQNNKVLSAFKEWMTSMVHSLYTLAGKSSSNIEVVELQLAGCVLVTVLARLGWLDARGTLDKLGIDILIELMNLLKLPLTNPTLIQRWCTDFRGRITPEIRTELVPSLQMFWVHMARRDRLHFDVIPLILEVSGKSVPDDVFHEIGFKQSTFLSSFPVTNIKKFKTSIAECSALCLSFPAIVTLVLHGIPVKHWHELDIADHMPNDQYLALALTTKMKQLSDADQVKYAGSIGQFLVTLLVNTNGLQFCTFTKDQLKTLQTSWCTITPSCLRKSKVPLDMKVVVLRMCFCVLTQVKLNLNVAEFKDVLISMREAVNEGIKNVILSRPYDMKRDDLLGFGINVTEELKVWNCMLSDDVFVAAEICQDAWTDICCQAIKQRVDPLTLQAKFDSLEKLEKILHHVEVLEKILLDSAMEAFNSELHDDERAQYFHGNVSSQMSIILNKFLTKKYEDITAINFEELCTWSLWPSYFRLWRGKDASEAIAEKDECFAYVQGSQLLDSVITSITNEEVNVECIETITRHRKNFEELVKCCYGQPNDVDYILQRTQLLASIIAQFEEMRRSLLFLSRECLTVLSANRETRGELISIQNLCRKGIQTCPVIRLQEHFSGHPVVERLHPILSSFCQIFDTFRSDITSKLWMQVCEQDVTSIQDLVERVWPIFIGTLQKMVVSLSQLTVPCGEAEFLMPTGTAPQQLRNVVKALMACQLTGRVNINVDEISSKVRLYDGLKVVSKQAEQLLRVVRNFGLEGDFTVVVNIANIPSRLAEQPISVLDRGYAEVAEFLNEYSVLHASLEELSSSQELIEWLKTAMKDVHQLQTFTNIALMTQCTDGYIVDLLTSLDQVVMKLAPLIFDLQRHDDLKNFMKHCCALRREHLSAIPEKVQMCRDKLMWYKTIQSTMGSVEETAFGQLKEITQHGVYVIHVGDGIPKDIKGLVKVHILKQRSAKHEYTLDELKDLQSKLALIKGKMTEKDIKVVADRFWQALELTVRIASTLLELLLMGHVKYRKFKYSLYSDEVIHKLQEWARQIESDLEEWRTTVEKRRSKYYQMNYFTTRQLSLICRELTALHNITHISFNPCFVDLMRSVCHTIDVDRVATAAVMIMERRNKMKKASLICTDSGNSPSLEDSIGDDSQGAASKIDSDSLQRMYGVLPLKLDDLNETQQECLEELREYDFSDELILIALSAKGCTFNDVLKYCVKFSSSDVDLGSELPCVVEAAVQEDRLPYLPLNENHPLVKDMVESGFDLELAIKAAEVCKCDQEQMLLYCLEQEQVSRGGEGMVSRNQMPEPEIEVPSLPQTVIVDVAEEDLWSLENVGQFLQCVAEQHAEDIHHFLPSARAFSHFQIGAPNLIVVPRDQLLRTVLSVYMPGHDLPLPTFEEVLFCDSMTTSEEIRLLWRRAVSDHKSRRIFCLVCEHNMSYKRAKKAVQDLRELVQGKKSVFRLVIICCKEDEVSSLLVGDLREYRQNPPPLPTMKSAQEYLRNHFADDALKATEDLHILGTSISVDAIANQSYVRLVTSERSGMGKSLYVSRKVAELGCALTSHNRLRSATLHGPELSRDNAVKALQIASSKDTDIYPYIYHLEISERVLDDIGSILFSMMILRGLQDSEGNIWRCKLKNVHLIEVTVPESGPNAKHWSNSNDLIHLLPMTRCLSPCECLHEQSPTTDEVVRMDEKERLSEPYQRVFQYLIRYHHNLSVDEFTYHCTHTEGDETDCIQLLLKFFELPDPSWAELNYFVKFLNTQLMACEHSVYCDEAIISDRSQGVYGFKSFVVKFMIRMAVDFTVPSLQSEYRNQMDTEKSVAVQALQAPDIEGYQVVQRRAWEKNVHPYIFFNRDTSSGREVYYDSMTFVGFNFQQVEKTVNLIDLQIHTIEENIMAVGLYRWMCESGVESRQDPNTWTKVEILKKLHRVLESSTLDPDDFYFQLIDPDPSYALTFDNLVKMLAIQMRFRCGIPVVIMGETGCGKTRLVRYMCQLQARLNIDPSVPTFEQPQNFFIMKIHGGVTEEDITHFVSHVQEVAAKNQENGLDTVLFFDEANTTDAIELIKEIMCDRRLNGETIQEGVKFIAACNPYKRHSDDAIEKLESAGLGFFIKEEETKQKLGSTPLRHLVYRVLDLPASMKPLVYDYGSLSTATERAYIRRIVENHVERNNQLRDIHNLTEALTLILSWCQDYMRERKDECSYVSLRDVERFMIVFEWFHKSYNVIAAEMTEVSATEEPIPNPYTLAMIMSLVVCYYSRLLDRCEFEHQLVQHLVPPLRLQNGRDTFCDVVQCCQEAFLENMELGNNIAHNTALRENVFMMAVCVELRIPLFVVGKPGSSKSLAKSIIAESMKGQNSKKDFLKNFKTVKLISYQCSQLSTPESIMDVFRNARQIQDGLDYRTDVALVVLDEVGLAEDSPTFPLKALHPLLEDGTDGSDHKEQIVAQEKRVAFIGISNWALDPAKMNRGIMVLRGEPSIDELVNSARGICSNLLADPIRDYLDPIMKPLAEAYLRILKRQEGKRKEFFGLRDFYSLIKMLYWMIWNNCEAEDNHATEFYLTVSQLTLAVRRNFGGSDEFDPLCEFQDCLQSDTLMQDDADTEADDSPLDLIKASLRNKERSVHGENRYLLFLTENDAALEIMHRFLFQREETQPHVLFGSSFPKDKDYTQVCRNINQIKICMEAGRTVVLLNLDNLYESLYDLLNQYYTKMGHIRYVDLGLQTHRIKCRVHDDFKLILIAEKDKVYDKFPIPLINRLEKHLVTTSTILLPRQQEVLRRLEQWIDGFTEVQGFKRGDAFIGFQSQTPATVVLQASQHLSEALHDSQHKGVLNTCKELLVQMACPDALARLKSTPLRRDETEEIRDMYFTKQKHLGLDHLILEQLQTPLLDDKTMGMQLHVTTHSRPLAPVDVSWLCRILKISKKAVEHMYLEELDTEADFTDRILKHISTVKEKHTYILVQCSSGHLNKDLISCARHKAIDELENFRQRDEWEVDYARLNRRIHVIFIVSLPKLPGGTKFAAFQGGKWLCVHLDDLRSPEANALTFVAAVQHPISELFYPGCRGIALHQRLRNCIQAAVSQIPEALDKPSRKVQLLNTLLGAIPEHMEVVEGSFYGILVRKLKRIIAQKEEIHTEEGWAIAEALNPHSLHEGGTYLNTLLRRIDDDLTSYLSYTVEYVDRWNNLNLYGDENLQQFWLEVFRNDDICKLDYTAIKHRRNDEVPDVLQATENVGALPLTCKFPFSWLFLSAIEDQFTSSVDSLTTCVERLNNAQYVGTFLYESTIEAAVLEVYLKDFVAITLQPTSDLEAQVLEMTLQALSYHLLDGVDCPTPLHRVISYHFAYHKNELQFLNYRELGRIFEDIHSLVLTEFVDHKEEPLQPLDLFAAGHLLRKITPAPVTNKKFWDLQYLRDVYVKNLRECKGILERILRGPAVSPLQVEVRHKWQKIRAVQMYIEHLILPLPNHTEVMKGAFRLWKLLKHVSSFKAKDGVDNLLTILRAVDDCVAKSFGLMTKAEKKAAARTTSRSEGYGDFCRAVKMLFLEVVSVLCFGQGSYEPPTPDLIEVLMKQIFKKEQVTQDLTPLPWEEPDSSPVVRSVLLQLILMGSTHNEMFEAMDEKQETMVTTFMDTSLKYLHGASKDGLYIMVVRCLEDAAFKIRIADQRSKDISRSLETLGHIVESAVKVYVQHDPAGPVTYRWLRSIAHLRFALAVLADMLSMYVADTPEKLSLTPRDSKMLEELVKFLSPLLLRENLQGLSMYLAKHLARRHGMKTLKCLYNQGHRFVLPLALHQQTLNHSPDYFVLCGGAYREMREALTQSIVDESVDHFQQHIQVCPASHAPLLPLVLFSKLAWPSGSSCSPSEEFVEEVSSACQGICNVEPELVDISRGLLDRNISGRSRIMQPSQDPSDRMLTALVLHVVSTVLSKKSDPLVQPFVAILTNPQALKVMYLPTMPEDNLLEAMTTIRDAKFYACPKGHPYTIGDCTRPIVQAVCKTCGAGIGGLNHQLQAGNYELQSVKRQETGYLLGPADTRSEAIPERSLSPLACAVMRFILHACFVWSACHQTEESVKAIKTTMITDVTDLETDLASFFWDHLKKDLRIIGKCLPRGENEVLMMLHRVVQHVAGMQPTTGVDGSMVSNANRRVWEDQFQRLVLAPNLQSVDALIQESLDIMAADNEHDEVFLAVYERSRKEPTMTQILWAFRARISLENFSRAFISMPNAKTLHPLLHTFLHEEPLLKALQYLPDIIKLQRVLSRHFNLKIDRNECQTQVTIRNAIDQATTPSAVEAVERSTLNDCLDSFRQAWKLVKEMLPNHRVACVNYKLAMPNDAQNKNIGDVPNSQDMGAVTNDYVQRMGDISEHLPVAYLLPCTSGPGLCSLALSDFLSRQQNKLLEFCSKQKAFSGFNRTSVPLVKVQPFHMVSYEGEIDSVILTHCRYSLLFGEGQEVEYDFAAIEKHIYDRFLVTKPEMDRRSQPLMVYTSDIIRRDVFQQLKENLKPQVALSSEEQKEVLLRLHRHLRSIQEALRVVTTAMGFLAGEGGRLDMPLSQYLLKVLRLRKTEFCGRCTLQHILSLWETLALEKVRMHSLNGMEVPFDGYDQTMVELFKDMPPEVKVQFDVKKYPLNPLMKLLFHFIQVRLRMLEPAQFEWPLKDCLPHCDSNVEELDVEWVDDLPEDILVEHAVHVWHITVRHQAQLLQEGRAY